MGAFDSGAAAAVALAVDCECALKSISITAVLLPFSVIALAATPPNPPLDFFQSSPTFTGLYAGADGSGNLYTVAIATSAATVQTTPGALQATEQSNVLWVQKFTPDGATLLYSATIGSVYTVDFPSTAAKVDSAGDVFIAYQIGGAVAGVTTWSGDSSGEMAVIEVSPGGDKIVAATRINIYPGESTAIDVDDTGAAYIGVAGVPNPTFAKVNAGGGVGSTYTLSAVASSLSIAVGSDHTLFASLLPDSVYHLDLDNQKILYQTTLTDSKDAFTSGISVSSITVDGSGNAYVAGYLEYGDGTPVFPLNPVDFTQAVPTSIHAFIVKLDPSGNTVFANAFSTEYLLQICRDSSGNIWAAGGDQQGFTVLAVDPNSGQLQHYITLPAIGNFAGSYLPGARNLVFSLTIDSTGRPIFSGSTPSIQLPDPGPGEEILSQGFFARIMANPPQADLQVTVDTSVPVAGLNAFITETITVTNRGSGPANDVRVRTNTNTSIFSCQITGAGSCSWDLHTMQIGWPVLLPGDTEYVELQLQTFYQTPAAPGPLTGSVSVLTTSDNPDQARSNSFFSVGINSNSVLALLTSVGPGRPSQAVVNDVIYPAYTIKQGIGVSPDSNVAIYIPSPQVIVSQNSLAGIPYIFQSWADGSTQNPRTFALGQPTPPLGFVIHFNMPAFVGPWVNPDSPIVNGASFQTGAIAPGEIVTLFGTNLGPANLQTAQLDSTGKIATTLSGLQVSFNGVPAPVVYASTGQTAVIVPYEVAGLSSVGLSIQNGQSVSTTIQIPVTDSAPALFTSNSAGNGPLGAFNQDQSLNSAANPAAPGDTVVFFGTGEGLTNAPLDGVIAGSGPPQPILPVTVTIGGLPAKVVYAGGVPGQTAGLLQLNIVVPPSAPSGLLPVVLTVGTKSSQWGATIAVR